MTQKLVRKNLVIIIMLCISIICLSACGSSPAAPVATSQSSAPAASSNSPDAQPDKVYTLEIGHSQPTTNPRHVSLEKFKADVESKTNGGIKINIYPAGQLGSEKEMLEAVKMGTLLGMRGGQFDFLPRLQMFTLPFLVEDSEQINKLLTSDLAQKIMAEAQNDNMMILAIGDAGGFRHFSNNKRMIKKPEDLVGLKMRTPGMDTIIRTFDALGASTVSIPYNDLYMALKTGVADGQENPAVNVESMKFYEVQKYVTVINYQFHPDPFYVNMDFYNSLPDEYKKILNECSVEMMTYNNQILADMETAAFDVIRNNCEVYELTVEERNAFKQAVKDVYNSFIEDGLYTQEELNELLSIAAS